MDDVLVNNGDNGDARGNNICGIGGFRLDYDAKAFARLLFHITLPITFKKPLQKY
jgi:hypothetical protein